MAQWRRYLAEYSDEVLRAAPGEALDDITEEQRAAGWLGFGGATPERLADVERRLGTALPPSYRAFLAVSDGWLNLGPFLWTMRTTATIGWLRDIDPELRDSLMDETEDDEEPGVPGLGDRALLISGDGDAQYWLLDPQDVDAGGEWAAYIWASWYPGLGERHESFAALVDAERASFAELNGRDGRPVDPEGASDLVAAGRAAALRGDVAAAADAFAQATTKGSGAAAYLAVILGAFLQPSMVHHAIRNDVLAKAHVLDAIGVEQIRAEAVPLFLQRSPIRPYQDLFVGILTPGELDRIDTFIPPLLTEPPAFLQALDEARRLIHADQPDAAWAVLAAAIPGWHSDSPHRIAPVILLTDRELRRLITPDRARLIVTTPRGQARTGDASGFPA
ncbi:hypothetical protein GCM10025331_38150 [Actinoplanes utahensis]|nr:hypothetical protein Aut01nite_45520 [Actinoplanes utahensis]